MPSLSSKLLQQRFLHAKAYQDENAQLLEKIYQGTPLFYGNGADFLRCKEQLLILLNFFISNCHLEFFKPYLTKVEELNEEFLSSSGGIKNVTITLRAAKGLLEEHALQILTCADKVPANLFDRYSLNHCYSGAYSHLTQVLSHFYVDNLTGVLIQAKLLLIKNFIAEYILKKGFLHTEGHLLVGNEVHISNAFFNYIAEGYGFQPITDFLAPSFSVEKLEKFKEKLKRFFTVSNYLQCLLTFLPALPTTVICSEDKEHYESQMKAIYHFVDFFQDKALSQQLFNSLYIEEEDYERAYYRLSPVEKIESLYSCILAVFLEKEGYLEQVTLAHQGQIFIDAEIAVCQKEENNFRLIKVELLNGWFESEELPPSFLNALLQELTTESLYDLIQQNSLSLKKRENALELLLLREFSQELIRNFIQEQSGNKNFTEIFYKKISISILKNQGKKLEISALYQLFLDLGIEEQQHIFFYWLRNKNIECIEIILNNFDAMPFLSIRDQQGNSPLLYSIRKKDLAIVELLLRKGADPNVFLEWSEPPLFAALYTGDLNLFCLLLQYKADPKLPWVYDEERYELLHEAIKHRQAPFVKVLLENGANPNFSGFQDLGSLFGVPLLVHQKKLLFKGAPLFFAIQYNCLDSAKLLIEKGANKAYEFKGPLTWLDLWLEKCLARGLNDAGQDPGFLLRLSYIKRKINQENKNNILFRSKDLAFLFNNQVYKAVYEVSPSATAKRLEKRLELLSEPLYSRFNLFVLLKNKELSHLMLQAFLRNAGLTTLWEIYQDPAFFEFVNLKEELVYFLLQEPLSYFQLLMIAYQEKLADFIERAFSQFIERATPQLLHALRAEGISLNFPFENGLNLLYLFVLKGRLDLIESLIEDNYGAMKEKVLFSFALLETLKRLGLKDDKVLKKCLGKHFSPLELALNLAAITKQVKIEESLNSLLKECLVEPEAGQETISLGC